jgi:2-polyprenyl-6-methoxyphenol hydroxylase-like FAD-dependent oxidoreductase
MSASYDVAVVGAGPVGTATALARAGARVALLDKATLARDGRSSGILVSRS